MSSAISLLSYLAKELCLRVKDVFARLLFAENVFLVDRFVNGLVIGKCFGDAPYNPLFLVCERFSLSLIGRLDTVHEFSVIIQLRTMRHGRVRGPCHALTQISEGDHVRVEQVLPGIEDTLVGGAKDFPSQGLPKLPKDELDSWQGHLDPITYAIWEDAFHGREA